MLNFAKVCCITGALALVLAASGTVHAGLTTNGVAADVSNTSLLVKVDNKKKKHKDGQSQNSSGLTDCTIVSPGGGGGCKTGFKYVCEKMKSGNKCCGCVADKHAKQAPAQTDQKADDNVLWGDYQTKPQQAPEKGSAQDQVDTQNKAEGRFGVGFDPVSPAQ
jgi:hypothetical protein